MLLIVAISGWFAVPFVLQQDVWPLLRMGMFAQSAKANLADEHWQIMQDNTLFDPTTIGFSQGNLLMLCRRAYYGGQGRKLLRDIGQAAGAPNGTNMKLMRTVQAKPEIVAHWVVGNDVPNIGGPDYDPANGQLNDSVNGHADE